MPERFYTILTDKGKEKFANAQITGQKVDIFEMALGDSNGIYYEPSEIDYKLRNEVWRGDINSLHIDEEKNNRIVIETILPPEIGGFTVREAAIFDVDGDMIAIGKYPETFKPDFSSGSAKDLYVRMVIEVSNPSSVIIEVDPAVTLASKKYVNDTVKPIQELANQNHQTLVNELTEDKIKPIIIGAGQQIINAVKRSPVTVKSFVGKTVVNLIPPFTSRDWVKHANATVSSDGRTLMLNSTENYQDTAIFYPAKPNTTYRILFKKTGNGGYGSISFRNTDNVLSGEIANTFHLPGKHHTITFTTLSNTKEVRVALTNNAIGTFTFSDLILTEGTEQHEYAQGVQHTTGVYLENETNGTYQYFARDSKGDVLRLADGEYIEGNKKNKTTEVVELTGRENYSLRSSATGYKRINVQGIHGALVDGGYIVKYDGKVLTQLSATNVADTYVYVPTENTYVIVVANTDSGWGDNYTPTADEIKAYFMGWRMYGWNGSIIFPYNGSAEKRWIKIWSGIGDFDPAINGSVNGSQVSILPNSMNDMGYKPYQLHYKLAEPYWEEIITEGQCVLEEGQNHVTLGSGLVVREIAKPQKAISLDLYGVNIIDNNGAFSAGNIKRSKFKYGGERVVETYVNSTNEGTFLISNGTPSYAYIWGYNYNPKAQYTVTYLAIPHEITCGINEVQAEVYENIKSVVDKNVVDIAKVQKEVDVLTFNTQRDLSMFASKKQEEWRNAVLMNGWVNTNAGTQTAGFYKDEMGNVHLKGTIQGGLTTSATTLFILPVGYRPKEQIVREIGSRRVDVASDGRVLFGLSAANSMLSLNGIIFRAEQ